MPNVLKASGKLEPFSEEKLSLSIKRAGVPINLQNEAINDVKNKLYPNIKTAEIYGHITDFLRKSEGQPFLHTKYGLKQSIMDLGPTGYPFEDYVAEILKMEGYATQVRQILQGRCISHEIDILSEKNNIKSVIECKYHNSPGTRSQIHVSLYTKARFDDLKERNGITDAWLITNTKITSDALNYALCSNMKVISWDYPEKGNFRDLIEKHRLYPVTIFTSLTQNQKQQLLQNHVVLSKNVFEKPESIDCLGLPKDKREQVISEAKFASSL